MAQRTEYCEEPGYAPGPSWFQRVGVLHHVVYRVLPVQSTVLPVYTYSAMFSVINQYCPNCCPYCPSTVVTPSLYRLYPSCYTHTHTHSAHVLAATGPFCLCFILVATLTVLCMCSSKCTHLFSDRFLFKICFCFCWTGAQLVQCSHTFIFTLLSVFSQLAAVLSPVLDPRRIHRP